jgi:hypothetical protein
MKLESISDPPAALVVAVTLVVWVDSLAAASMAL